ncbi:MAG TPA: hypothetical protein PLF48_09815 [Chitinophagales bacterium]|nr:hypothetical protein [Chitinophagales bacterium]
MSELLSEGKTTWRSPSNIALIKYWGKHGRQLPRNASISFTLSQAYTETSLLFEKKKETSDAISLEFLFEQKKQEAFEIKLKKYLTEMLEFIPVLSQYHLRIQSSNSFPHSTGIASSASSMSALAMCLTDMENEILHPETETSLRLQKASKLARLGSGSACRSIYPSMAVWGKHPHIPDSADEYAIPYTDHIHPVFKTYKDAILIVSSTEKEVSSRAGHALMENNYFASSRYRQADDNMSEIIIALKSADLEHFCEIVENEALTLHALMMASQPSFMLLKPNTLKIIDLLKTFRKENNVPLCFTLDAGPNLHLLYPQEYALQAETFIEQELLGYCENRKVIYDSVGIGPEKIN